MGTSPPPPPAIPRRCRRSSPSPSLAVKKGSESWGCLPAGLRARSGVFPLPLLRRWAVGPLSPLLPVSSSSRSSFILEEASPSKSFRRVSTLDPPGVSRAEAWPPPPSLRRPWLRQLAFRPLLRHGQSRLPEPAAAESSQLPTLPAPLPSWPSPQRPSVARPRWRPS